MINHTFLNIFKDRHGHTVMIQKPNLAITSWAVFKIISVFVSNGELQDSFSYLANAFLFTWAYLEIRSGVNTFRKLLGLGVLLIILASIF